MNHSIQKSIDPDLTHPQALHSQALHSQALHSQDMKHLIGVIQALSLARTQEAITAIVSVTARKLADADGASFELQDKDQCFYTDEDSITPLWKGQRFPLKTCLGEWVMEHRQPAIVEDIYRDGRIPNGAYQSTYVKSLVMVPIRKLDPIGAISVYWARPHQPTQSEVELLQALADTTAVALNNVQVYTELEQQVHDRIIELEFVNARLRAELMERQAAEAEIRRLSLTDELTGLHNRRGLLLLAEPQLKLAQRLNTSVCLLFIDVDGLKQVNDNYGHEIGDCLIKNVAQVLKQTFRESDIIARLGGDEFVVLLPNCTGSEEAVKQLQENVSQFNWEYDNSYQLSMSIGSVRCQVNQSTSLEAMIAEADQLMYAHKRSKRHF